MIIQKTKIKIYIYNKKREREREGTNKQSKTMNSEIWLFLVERVAVFADE